MFYRGIRAINTRKFDREIEGILDTKPLILQDASWCIVSMVANRDVPMYLTAIKSFYPKIGRGKVVAIIDQAMPQTLRDTLAAHLVGIEFVILEDIETAPCQKGGTWERLLYCLDRSEREFTIQLDCDTLAVNDDLSEVVACLEANRAFTMSDGFARTMLREAARLAQATPSNYIGITAERAFDRYAGGEDLHYIRGSSGFAGFAKGGATRAAIGLFHQEMERLVGAQRWREWGSEQCGSNFAIANSPDPLVLPYPEYASFKDGVLREEAKLFHFIGAFRFKDRYFARRSREVIAGLEASVGAVASAEAEQVTALSRRLPLLFARSLTPGSLARYVAWRLAGGRRPVTLRMRARTEFQTRPDAGPAFRLPARSAAKNDDGGAYGVFALKHLMPPVWIPPESVELIVDLGAGVGVSCLWWLSNYWRARVVAFEAHHGCAAQARTNIALNGYESRIDLHEAPIEPESDGSSTRWIDVLFATLSGRRIDILKIDGERSGLAFLDDVRFGTLDIRSVVATCRAATQPGSAEGNGASSACGGRACAPT